MNTALTFPSKINCISRITGAIDVSCIIDVGVRECTDELIKCFPHLKHYLFEPMKHLEGKIRENYKKIQNEVYFTALSDEDSTMYLLETSLSKNGVITHSTIKRNPSHIDGLEVIACNEIEVRRFDSLPLSKDIPNDFLLKIDVDGKDLQVVKGFGEKIHTASIIIIECTLDTLSERASFIEELGFKLIDLVDLVYYGNSLYQLDAILIRKDLAKDSICPPITSFNRSLWQPFNEK